MEPKGILLCSQEPTADFCPEPVEPSSLTISLKFILILFTNLCLDLPYDLLHSYFPTQILYAFLISSMCAT